MKTLLINTAKNVMVGSLYALAFCTTVTAVSFVIWVNYFII